MMRHRGRILGWLLWAVLAVWLPTAALAQTFSSGSTGAQGAFPPTGADAPPTGTTQYSLSLTDGKLWYVPGWTLVTLPNVPAGGFRDGVLNFTTFSVPSGVTMYFYKNAANTPVTLLATGSVSISGTIDVSGAAAPAWGRPGTGGPGGFDGGAGGDGLSMTSGGVGLGPGGGGTGTVSGGAGGGGSYGSTGVAGANSYCSGCTNGAGGAMYGSGFLRPIIGGSGGGGSAGAIGNVAGGGGGGGGGAILIVSSSSITLNSSAIIRANGGSGYYVNWSSGGGGGGAGGAIRLIAPTITGTGSLYAQGGTANYGGGTGGNGRIRLEATTLSFTGSSTPLTVTSLPQPVFPSTGQPALAVTSIGGMSVPANPVGSVLAAPDVLLPVGTGSSVAVTVTASNVPIGTTVQLTAAPQSGNRTTASCALLDGSQASSSCTASITISLTQTNILIASALFPLVASAGDGPIYAEGEEVKWVRVASTLGGPSTVTYITATGKEIPATALASRAP